MFVNLLSYEEFENTKGVIRILKSKNRQHNSQNKKDRRTNNDLQNTHKTKDRVTETPLKTRGKLGCSGRGGSFYVLHGSNVYF